MTVLGLPGNSKTVKNLPAMWETWVQSLGQKDPLEKEMAIHSSFLAWGIPWTQEPGGLQSVGLQRVGQTEPPILTDSPRCLFTLELLNTDPTRGRVQTARSGRDSVEQYTVQLSCSLFAAPWTAACQASLSITNSRSLLKLMSTELVMPSNHLILLSSPFPPTFNLSRHQDLFKWVGS